MRRRFMIGRSKESTLPYARARKRARADASAKMNIQTQTKELVMKTLQKAMTLAVLAAAAMLGGSLPADASGLRTQFGEVVVRNLKIGQTYSLQKMINLPYRVTNTGEEPVDLTVDVIRLDTATLKDGYEALPSLD